ITTVRPEQMKPSSYALFNNYPNPFNPSTVISYQLPENSFVSLKVYDVIGNEVATLVNELQSAGVKNVTFKLKDKELGSGIYFYQLKAGSFVQTKKMLLLK
ncbi:MAG: T9SS type A sorting domain-containing protein, partial [Ignavibacteriaceae bacterium]